MTEEEKHIENGAVEFIKSSKKELIAKFCPLESCRPTARPVSLFMAGSPGAGKTEISKSFARRFKDAPVRIDADEIRSVCAGYSGENAHLFQKAANKGVNFLYDYALHNSINCIMDGTFAYADAEKNVQRSLDRGRKVEIWFVYQDPIRAWEFTKAREARESRRVSKEVFIRAFFESRMNAKLVKERFGTRVELNILMKDYDAGSEDILLDVPASELDRFADGRYSVDTLIDVLL